MRTKETPKFPEPGSPDTVQLWKRDGRDRYTNVASNFVAANAPSLLSGGILADDMGLGKTLQMISLIMEGGDGSTLVVAPVTVMSNWVQQIKRHVEPEKVPGIVVYHGSNKLPTKLTEYKVVVTSYGKLSSEYRGGVKRPLMATEWTRVILDEGHNIRNASTETAAAACALKAQSRWVVTGTPM
jgi:SWI/SNF-related matrix-associated actin-dependent regulator of chromatin subfamily A3